MVSASWSPIPFMARSRGLRNFHERIVPMSSSSSGASGSWWPSGSSFSLSWSGLPFCGDRDVFMRHRPFLRTLFIVHPLGFLATELGWITNEVGRQPWLVYNLMRTAEGVSPIPAGNVIWSLSLFLIIFPVIGASYFYYVLKTLARGPDLASPIPPIQRPAGMRPLQEIKSEELGDRGDRTELRIENSR